MHFTQQKKVVCVFFLSKSKYQMQGLCMAQDNIAKKGGFLQVC